MRILVTGGSGFIGSALIRHAIAQGHEILNLDKLTYAASPEALASVAGHPAYRLVEGDICDAVLVTRVLAEASPDLVMHLAAESHVDRSIDGPGAFVQTNIVGTFTLLQGVLACWRALSEPARSQFRFHHISTDEVFGSLGPDGLFSEATAYDPSSPYSASKAGSDHLVRAWGRTYGLPVVVSNCSNNYGPFHFPEKLIPLMIIKALHGEQLPVYGQGGNVRDWLHVEDHARALLTIATRGQAGESYNVGGGNERTNLATVQLICRLVDEAAGPLPSGAPRASLISFVQDRPGHDFRYAIDHAKVTRELGWRPQETFETGLASTVRWYLDHESWWRPLLAGRYGGERLGTAA